VAHKQVDLGFIIGRLNIDTGCDQLSWLSVSLFFILYCD